MADNLIIYDGDCGFCNRFILSIAKNDSANTFKFTPNHSQLARSIFEAEKIDPKFSEETIFLRMGNRLFTKGEALRVIFKQIPKYRFLYFLMMFINRHLIDLGYTLFSKIRRTIQMGNCEIPSKQIIEKFK